MKILIVGASGTIGKKVTEALKARNHEVITAGTKSGDLQVDITSADSIKQFYEKAGKFDALVSAAGAAYIGPFKTLTEKEFRVGVDSKFMGQVNLVLIGQHYINPKGSFTLTSGSLAFDPIANAASITAINSAVNGFVLGASVELENGVRINAVCPDVVEDSPELFEYFPGHRPSNMDDVVAGYIKSVLGVRTGEIIRM